MTVKEKILRVQNTLVIFIFVFVAVTISLIGKYEDISFEGSYELEDFKEWTVTYADGTSVKHIMPIDFVNRAGEAVELSMQLPGDIPEENGLMLCAGYCRIEAYVDGNLIHSFAREKHIPFGKLVGNPRVIVPLGPQYAQKTIILRVTPFYDARTEIGGVQYGNVHAFKFDVLYRNTWRIVVAAILFAIAVLCMGLSLYHFAKKAQVNNWTFYHLGLFVMYVQIWLICSSDLPQVITDTSDAASFVSFLALAIMPIHYAAFCVELIPESRNVFSIIQIVTWFVPFLEVVCFVLNICDPVDGFGPFSLLLLNHISIGVVAIGVLYESVKYRKNSRYIRFFSVTNITFMVAVAVSLVCFYIEPTGPMSGVVLTIGMVAFTSMLFGIILNMEVTMLEDIRAKDVYKEMAFTDVQTGINNRTAYNHFCEQIREMNVDYVDLIVMDINSLKWVNDNLGHLAGDSMIEGAANCIDRAFCKIGECYRIGGDEFAVVVLDNHEAVDEALAIMEDGISSFNKNYPEIRLSISVGRAQARHSDSILFMEKLFSKADNNMYQNKRKWHQENETDYIE